MTTSHPQPPLSPSPRGYAGNDDAGGTAVVIGLCAHSLDLVHALSGKGLAVHAVDSDPHLIAACTRKAIVDILPDVNGDGLIPSLLDLHRKRGFRGKPVLFPTNDRMVLMLADRFDELQDHYSLSWAGSRPRAREFLLKDHLGSHCQSVGLRYPHTYMLDSLEGAGRLPAELKYPLIVKPCKPQSSFKAELVEDRAGLEKLVRTSGQDLPFLVQHYIRGGVESLVFCALYYRDGEALAHFEGRKVATLPMGLGTTTIAEPAPDDLIYRESLKFFAPLRLSGPVSLEFKKDPDGLPWVIEPTMFRTDYWFGVCPPNGVNLAYMEYADVAGLPRPPVRETETRYWVDLERDPACIRYLMGPGGRLWRKPLRIGFTYGYLSDTGLFLRLLGLKASQLLGWFGRRIGIVRRGPAA